MRDRLLYLDSSAIVKLVANETETEALFDFLAHWQEPISSVIARIEVLGALRRAQSGRREYRRGEEVLERIALIRLDEHIVSVAAELDPPHLRALDAIHLATALSVKQDLGGIVCYDNRLARAAASLGLRIWRPH